MGTGAEALSELEVPFTQSVHKDKVPGQYTARDSKIRLFRYEYS